MIGLSSKVTFDKRRIADAVDDATSEQLEQSAAFIRESARRSIKTSDETSPAGSTPNSQTGQLQQIYFSFDASLNGFVIGPAKLSGVDTNAGLHEFGGISDDGHRYAPRPFMNPALRREVKNLLGRFAGSVK